MEEIVVGVDGSESSRAALRWAARLAAATNASLRAVMSWQYPASAASPTGPSGLPGPAKMDEQTGGQLRSILDDELVGDFSRVETEVGRGAPASVLLGVVRRDDAGLLVLGARGRGGFEGLLLGSVSQQCIEHSPCPVVVMRGGKDPSVGPIVVGLDGSQGSTQALDWTLDVAEATGADILAVHGVGTGASTEVCEAAGEALHRWCAPIRERRLPHRTHLEAGEPRSALEQAAEESEASLIVVGTRGLGPVRGLLLGSVAGYVARYAHRPIAVVPLPSN